MSDLTLLAGERAPLGLPITMTLIGVCCALASSWAFTAEPEAPPTPRVEPPATASREAQEAPSTPTQPRDAGATARDAAPTVDAAEPPVDAEAPSQAAPEDPERCPRFEDVLFDRGTRRPMPHVDTIAARVKAWSDAHPEIKIVLNGHSDAGGNEYKNFKLSRARADHVRERFRAAGIPLRRTQSRAFGAFKPIAGLDENSPQNRRVSIRIHGCPGEED